MKEKSNTEKLYVDLITLYRGLQKIERKYPGAIDACYEKLDACKNDHLDQIVVDQLVFNSLVEDDGFLWFETYSQDPVKWSSTTGSWEE